jgi:hypothetical protein
MYLPMYVHGYVRMYVGMCFILTILILNGKKSIIRHVIQAKPIFAKFNIHS